MTLQGHARRLQTKEQLQLSNLTENKTFLRPCAGKECPEVVRRLYSMRRRASTSMRRRGSIKPININPMSWFTPRRRRAYSATGAAAAAYGGAAAGAARRRGTAPTGDTGAGAGAVGGGSYSSVRRRISSMGTSSFHRRRSTPGFGGSYSNPYSSYSAPYGYPSSGWAYQSFGGHMPTSTPYGYTGANAYSSSSGVEIALAAGAGLLAGYALGHPHHHWNGYSQADMFGMQCISGPLGCSQNPGTMLSQVLFVSGSRKRRNRIHKGRPKDHDSRNCVGRATLVQELGREGVIPAFQLMEPIRAMSWCHQSLMLPATI